MFTKENISGSTYFGIMFAIGKFAYDVEWVYES
jgi:hypothetical protein